MTDISDRQKNILSRNLHEDELISDTYNPSKLNNVISLYRNVSKGKYNGHINDAQCILPNVADKLFDLSEDFRREINEDILDWETYMYCKENEERKNVVQITEPIRNCNRSDIVIKTYSKNCRHKMHNTFNGNCTYENGFEELYSGNISDKDERSKEQQAKVEKALGNTCFGEMRYVEACKHYTNSLNLYPTKEAFNNRAMAYIKMKNFTAALKDVNEVLKMDPTNEKASYRRAVCRKEMRMYEEALSVIKSDKLINKKSFSNLWNTVQNEMMKLQGKKYTVRPQNGSRKAFEIDISQLSAYASCEDKRYLLEVDRTGCMRSCVCGYCTEEDRRSKAKSSGLRIKDRNRWKPLTNALLSEMRIISSNIRECNDGISYETASDGVNEISKLTECEKPSSNIISSKTNVVNYARPTNFKNSNSVCKNEISSRQKCINFNNTDSSTIKKLLDEVKFMSTQSKETRNTGGFDANEQLVACLKSNDSSLPEKISNSSLDEKSLTILLKSVLENFRLEEWSQIYYILEAAAGTEQFHEIIKSVDETTKNRLFVLLDEAARLDLKNAASIKKKYV